MKQLGNMQFLVLPFMIIPGHLLAQNCENHHLEGDCQYDIERGYKVYSQSHSSSISPMDSVEFNVVFYGQKDYILSFCTHKKLYPIHFVLIDQQTQQILYDNKDEGFTNSWDFSVESTDEFIVRVIVDQNQNPEDTESGCVSMLIGFRAFGSRTLFK